MRRMNFRNTSSTIQSILNSPEDLGDNFSDLQFSTFRSDDYRFHDCLPHTYASPEEYSLEQFSILDHEEDEVSTTERVELWGIKRISFRNKGSLIAHLLGAELSKEKCRRKKMCYKNNSVLLSKLIGQSSKFN